MGAKIALPPIGSRPLALVASLLLPTGDDGFTSDELDGSAYMRPRVLVGGADDATSGALAALVSHPLQERWSAYVEGAALPGLEHAPDTAYAGGGVLWAPSDDRQIDLSFDFGLTGDSSDVLVGVGISWLF